MDVPNRSQEFYAEISFVNNSNLTGLPVILLLNLATLLLMPPLLPVSPLLLFSQSVSFLLLWQTPQPSLRLWTAPLLLIGSSIMHILSFCSFFISQWEKKFGI